MIENIEIDGKRIVEISKNFIDILFMDGDDYLNNLTNDKPNLEENLITELNVEIDNFEIEYYNLINKLNNLNANDNDIKNNENNDVFEEKETFNEYDSINYIKKNGKIKYVSKLPNNVIDNLYLIKRK